MNKIIKRLGLLLIPAPLQAAPDAGPQIAHLLREQGLQGAVWTTLDREGAAGVSNARTGTPMRVAQRVHVGSIAKTVLAVGVMQGFLHGQNLLLRIAAAMHWEVAFHAGALTYRVDIVPRRAS